MTFNERKFRVVKNSCSAFALTVHPTIIVINFYKQLGIDSPSFLDHEYAFNTTLKKR